MVTSHHEENAALYQGDCLEVFPFIPDDSVDCVITSPPYPGVNNMWGELFTAENFDLAHEFLDKVWDECLRVLKPGCKLIINIANTKRRPYLPNVSRVYWWARNKIEPLGEIIWNKGYGQNGTAWGSFRSPADMSLADQHEYILVFRKYGDRGKPEEFEKISIHDFKSWRNSIWNIPPAKAGKVGHVAPFPEQLPSRLTTLYTFENETVLDPFMGSGTTGLAALKLHRCFIGMDNNPKYFALAKKNIKSAVLSPSFLTPSNKVLHPTAFGAGTAKAISLLDNIQEDDSSATLGGG